jgi:transposase-like protein
MFAYATDPADGPATEVRQSLDEGARRMIEVALRLEVDEFIERLRGERDAKGEALVVRNGRARERKVTVSSGTLAFRAPRVNDRRPEQRFTSKILPPYLRRSPAGDEATQGSDALGVGVGRVGGHGLAVPGGGVHGRQSSPSGWPEYHAGLEPIMTHHADRAKAKRH